MILEGVVPTVGSVDNSKMWVKVGWVGILHSDRNQCLLWQLLFPLEIQIFMLCYCWPAIIIDIISAPLREKSSSLLDGLSDSMERYVVVV